MATHLKFFETSTAKLQKLASSNKGIDVNYSFDEACNSIQYGITRLDDIKEGAFCSGPMVGCHLVIGALNDKSFMAHNNEDPDCAWAKDQTIAMIKANPSGNYYLFFTSATLGIFSPKDYLKAMEESYGVIFEGAFYYDENESPRKSWVEVRYHPKSASLQVSGFTMTYPDMKSVRHDCPVVLLSKDTPSEHFNLPVQNRPNNRFSC